MNTSWEDIMLNNTSFLHWNAITDEDNLVWLSIDMHEKNTNVLSEDVLDEFDQLLDEIVSQKPAGLIIRSAKKNGFIAGADISSFAKISSKEEAVQLTSKAHGIFNKLESLAFPTLCIIHGFCLGGGLELALACSMRIASDDLSTKIGLPEVKLGIHPGFGGTVRLTNLIGAVKALPLMVAGKVLDAKQAKRAGIVDLAVPDRLLTQAARRLTLQERVKRKTDVINTLVETPILRPVLAKIFTRKLREKIDENHYPAPYSIINLWKNKSADLARQYKDEADSLADLIVHPTARNLTRIFFLQEKLKNLPGDQDFIPARVHIIGGGVMGGDIAAWCALQNLEVTIQDQNHQAIAGALTRAEKLFVYKLRQAHLVRSALDRLQPDPDGDGIAKADVIIEAIFENPEAKQNLFTMLEQKAKPEALLATNTSSIPLKTIGKNLKDPARLLGLHFFNPVSKMQLVEIIHDKQTGLQWINKGIQFTKTIKKLPIPVKSCPGFLVNRVLMPYLHEAATMVEEGIPMTVIDKAAKDFGMPVGPVELMDMVGLDICLSVSDFLRSENLTMPHIVEKLVADGHKGKKTGKGFYTYKQGKTVIPKQNSKYSPPPDIQDRLMLRMLNECVACLREKIVDGSEMLDGGLIFGTGFAPFTGGPIHFLHNDDNTGLFGTLQSLELKHGSRFSPDSGWTSITSM